MVINKIDVKTLEGTSIFEELGFKEKIEVSAEHNIGIDQLKELGAKDFYWRDLEGLEVVDTKGEILGSISHLIETGANDVMVVKLPAEKAKGQKIKEMMIPYLMDSVVKTVDLEANQMMVDWDDDYI